MLSGSMTRTVAADAPGAEPMNRSARSALSACVSVIAVVLLGVSASWACTSAGGPLVHDLFNDRGPVGTTVSVRGDGWLTSTPVEVGWRPASGSVQPLTSVVPDASGRFETSVVVPQAPAGMHQVVVLQGAVARLTPFEVTGGSVPGVAEAQSGDVVQFKEASLPVSSETAPSISGFALVGTAAALAALLAVGLAVPNSRRRVRFRSSR